jgi:hypothetical protein
LAARPPESDRLEQFGVPIGGRSLTGAGISMVEQSVSASEAALLTESALSSDGCAHLRRRYNGAWIGDIKMFRNLEQRSLMQFIDYQEVLPVKDRVRRSRITDAGRTVLAEFDICAKDVVAE